MKFPSYSFLLEKYQRHKDFGKLLSISVIFRGLIIVINLISGILISSEIGDSNRGIYNLFNTSLATFNVFLNFGLNSSAYYYANKKIESIRSYLVTNAVIAVLSAVIIFLCLIFFSYYLNFQSQILNYVFIICYIVYSFGAMYRSFLIGIHQNLYAQKLDLSLRFCFLIFVIFSLKFFHLSIIGLGIFFIMEFSLFSYFSQKKIGIKLYPIVIDTNLIKESWAFNAKGYIMSLLIILLMRGDQYIIKFFSNNAQVGFYATGNAIIENLSIISSMISLIYLPKFVENNNLPWMLSKARKLLQLIFILSLSIAFAFYFIAPYLLFLYFKSEQPDALLSFRILLVGFIFWSLFYIINTINYSLRYKKSNLILLLFTVVLNLGINVFFVPRYGIIASAVASSLCYGLLFILSMVDLFYLKQRNYYRKLEE